MAADEIKFENYVDTIVRDFYKFKPAIEETGLFPFSLDDGGMEECFKQYGYVTLRIPVSKIEKFKDSVKKLRVKYDLDS